MRRLAIIGLCSAVAALGCSSDSTGPEILAPTLSFGTTMLSTPYFTAGAGTAPTIAWNGETGTLALASAVQGVSIDSNTGIVSWDRSLPLGTNAVEVVASNSAGSDRVTLTIESEFQGQFVGGYNGDPTTQTLPYVFEMAFGSDGSVTVLDAGTNTGVGTWTRAGTVVTAVYSYNGGTTFFTVEGTVTHTASEATLEGFWWSGDGAVAGAEAGYLKVSIMP
jgi:hypothetical protein